jgi:hypothetical protein
VPRRRHFPDPQGRGGQPRQTSGQRNPITTTPAPAPKRLLRHRGDIDAWAKTASHETGMHPRHRIWGLYMQEIELSVGMQGASLLGEGPAWEQ